MILFEGFLNGVSIVLHHYFNLSFLLDQALTIYVNVLVLLLKKTLNALYFFSLLKKSLNALHIFSCSVIMHLKKTQILNFLCQSVVKILNLKCIFTMMQTKCSVISNTSIYIFPLVLFVVLQDLNALKIIEFFRQIHCLII